MAGLLVGPLLRLKTFYKYVRQVNMTFQIILVIHVLLALGLVGLILIQHGKGADAGAAFGSGAAGSVFGARGAHSFLYKLTAVLAVAFFVTSISLAYFASSETAALDPEQSIMTQSIMSDDDSESDSSEIPSN
jgi:preprotein translocase subunit SecG